MLKNGTNEGRKSDDDDDDDGDGGGEGGGKRRLLPRGTVHLGNAWGCFSRAFSPIVSPSRGIDIALKL